MAATAAEDREPLSTAVIYLLGALIAAVFCLLTVYMGGRAVFGDAEITVPRFETRVIAAQALSAADIAAGASFRFRDSGVDVDAWRSTAIDQAAQDPGAFIGQLVELVGRGEVEVRVRRYQIIPITTMLLNVALFVVAIGLLGWLALHFFRDAAALRRDGHFADGTTIASRKMG